MAVKKDRYEGREQTYFKHLFLTRYLEAAAYKIIQNEIKQHGRAIFNYVDAFAGPWRIQDEEAYSDTSFDQALRILDSVRNNLGNLSKKTEIRYIFCERNKDRFEKLRGYTDTKSEFNIEPIQGDFENNLNKIYHQCRSGFTFVLLDPTGWKLQSRRIFAFLSKLRCEFLFNFMAEHINRHALTSSVEASFGDLLNDKLWRKEFERLPSIYNNEERILLLLKKAMIASKSTCYVPDVPILNPKKNGVKMRLLLGTKSKVGLEVFRNVQKKVEEDAFVAIERAREISKQQYSFILLFAEAKLKNEGSGCPKYMDQARYQIIQILESEKQLRFDSIMVDVLAKIPVRRTDLNAILKIMKEDGIVNYEIPPRTVPKDDTIISIGNKQLLI